VGTFDILSPDGHPLFVADLPNERGDGAPHHQYVRNEQELQRFIATRDKPGRATSMARGCGDCATARTIKHCVEKPSRKRAS
jgi:hypothetical protein